MMFKEQLTSIAVIPIDHMDLRTTGIGQLVEETIFDLSKISAFQNILRLGTVKFVGVQILPDCKILR